MRLRSLEGGVKIGASRERTLELIVLHRSRLAGPHADLTLQGDRPPRHRGCIRRRIDGIKDAPGGSAGTAGHDLWPIHSHRVSPGVDHVSEDGGLRVGVAQMADRLPDVLTHQTVEALAKGWDWRRFCDAPKFDRLAGH